MSNKFPALILGVFLAIARTAMADASDEPSVGGVPEYGAEVCCSVCPRVEDRAAYVSEYMRGYRVVVEGKDGWLFRTDAELQWFEPNDPDLWPSLKRLIDALKAKGSTVLMFPQPPRGLVESAMIPPEARAKYDLIELQRRYSELVSKLRDAGAIVADGSVFSNNQGTQYFYKRDGHWKAAGSERAAQMIANQIHGAGFTFTPKEFTTFQTGLTGSKGTMTQVVDTLCGVRYPVEYGPAYQTKTPATDDLFGDASAPEVALVGTSFSATPAYNFHGFLRSALKTDIYQAAKSGGGFDGAMSEYLVSDLYQQTPPKFIVWEFPYQQLQRTTTTVMRRLIPLVSNGCAGKKALLKGTAKLEQKTEPVEAVVNGSGAFITVPAKNLWFDFQFSDPNIREIQAEVWYADGRFQTINSQYNAYTNMNGRFVLETNYLPDTENQSIVSIRIKSNTPTPPNTEVATTVCSHE